MGDVSTWSAIEVATAFLFSAVVVAAAAGLGMMLLASVDYFRDGEC